jgi:hypothetical protein
MLQQWTQAGLMAALMVSGAAMAAPDFSGVWQAEGNVQELRTVDGKAPPLNAAAAKLYATHRAQFKKGDLSFDPTATCISPGMPRILTLPYPFEIMQSDKKLTYLFQWNYWNRFVYLDANKAKEVPYPLAMGLSHGKWQGDTLVVETTDLRADNTLLDSMGMPRGDALKLTEKLRLVDANTLEARLTVSDAQTFTKDWDTVLRFKRRPKGTEITEDICLDRVDAGKPAVDWKPRG